MLWPWTFTPALMHLPSYKCRQVVQYGNVASSSSSLLLLSLLLLLLSLLLLTITSSLCSADWHAGAWLTGQQGRVWAGLLRRQAGLHRQRHVRLAQQQQPGRAECSATEARTHQAAEEERAARFASQAAAAHTDRSRSRLCQGALLGLLCACWVCLEFIRLASCLPRCSFELALCLTGFLWLYLACLVLAKLALSLSGLFLFYHWTNRVMSWRYFTPKKAALCNFEAKEEMWVCWACFVLVELDVCLLGLRTALFASFDTWAVYKGESHNGSLWE